VSDDSRATARARTLRSPLVSSFEPTATEIFIDDGDNFVASYKSVILQVRRGAMTLPVVEQMGSLLRLLRARQRSQAGALLAVLEESAELPTAAVRTRQVALLRELLTHERSWAATVVAEGTAKGALLRTFMRLLALGHPRVGVFATGPEAGAWLEERVHLPSAEIASFMAWGRRVATASQAARDAAEGKPRTER
jgi:hypothetical protein